MKFLALLAVLLVEQVRPLHEDNRAQAWFGEYAATVDRHFNAGQYRHGVLAWLAVVAPIVIATTLAAHLLDAMSPLLGLLWSVAILYLTMGFRRFSHYVAEIEQALRAGDLALARERLGEWRGQGPGELGGGEIARVAIEQGLLASHRQVFGAIAWFVVLGPAGAMLYRAAAILAETWAARTDGDAAAFGRFAARAFCWIDWVPARLTAAAFAIVGNFEDAVYCWRMQAQAWATHAHGIILASGGGALGVKLGDTLHREGGLEYRPELGTGEEADVEHMESVVDLIWRAIVLWMFVILIVTFARALG